MQQRVFLTLGSGDWQHGFASITLQLWEAGSDSPMQFSGSLPAAPALDQTFQQWRSLYVALYGHCGVWRRFDSTASGDPASCPEPIYRAAFGDDFPIDIDEDDITHVSAAEFVQLSDDLQQQFNGWLESPAFRSVDQQLRTALSRSDEIRIILLAQDQTVLRYPWQLWKLLEDYPQAELALSPIDYRRPFKKRHTREPGNVRVLAILGDAQDIDVATDQLLLSDLPGAAVTILAEPKSEELDQQLWQGSWDILFFAGHSSSQTQGVLQLNRREVIPLTRLKFGLRHAIANGLQMAIFNSCDGLGLAWDLTDLDIPQVIVMREPVPDHVAHVFLKRFLRAFAEDQPFYLAVRAAREQLQPLEPVCPCATWLPVIVQNPAEHPVSWRMLQGYPSEPTPLPPTPAALSPAAPTPAALNPAALNPAASNPAASNPAAPTRPTSNPAASNPAPVHHSPQQPALARYLRLLRSLWIPLATTTAVVGLRLLGALEPVELYGFDRLMRLRPIEPLDARLLVVTIDEADIQAQPDDRRGSLSDAALDQLLQTLDRYQARVVGLDIYRDYSVGPNYLELAERLSKSDRIVGVCKSRDADIDPVGVRPPPELAEALIGFSDFLDDSDGVVRRHLVGLKADPISPCTTDYAFSARLAFLYLQDMQIAPRFGSDGSLVLGEAVLPPLQPRSGGYQPIDARGYQTLLNYRALPEPSAIAERVSLTQILNGEVNAEAIAGRIVLIGVTAHSLTDDWATPYGASSGDKTAGVFLQAQMTSQLISVALGERPLLRVWSQWGDILWIGGWALAGWGLGSAAGHLNQGQWWWRLAYIGTGGLLLVGGSLWLLVAGVWVPLVPAALAFGGVGLGAGRQYQSS